MSLPNSSEICSGSANVVTPKPVAATHSVTPPEPKVRVANTRSLPNFSFTGSIISSSKLNAAAILNDAGSSYELAPDTQQTAELVKTQWKNLLDDFEKKGKIRVKAALSHAEFVGNKVIITVGNKSIEQEIVDMKQDLLEQIYNVIKLRITIEIIVTEDEVFVAKPVSDSQRLVAMIEHNSSIKDLCNELKLRL